MMRPWCDAVAAGASNLEDFDSMVCNACTRGPHEWLFMLTPARINPRSEERLYFLSGTCDLRCSSKMPSGVQVHIQRHLPAGDYF